MDPNYSVLPPYNKATDKLSEIERKGDLIVQETHRRIDEIYQGELQRIQDDAAREEERQQREKGQFEQARQAHEHLLEKRNQQFQHQAVIEREKMTRDEEAFKVEEQKKNSEFQEMLRQRNALPSGINPPFQPKPNHHLELQGLTPLPPMASLQPLPPLGQFRNDNLPQNTIHYLPQTELALKPLPSLPPLDSNKKSGQNPFGLPK